MVAAFGSNRCPGFVRAEPLNGVKKKLASLAHSVGSPIALRNRTMVALRKKIRGPKRASPEEALLEYARSLKRHLGGRRAVLVQYSNLTRYSRQPRNHRSTLELFKPLMKKFDGQLFTLQNDDIVCVLHGARIADMDSVVLNIRYLFCDDENLKAVEDAGDDDILTRWFDLAKDYKAFLAFARDRLAEPLPEIEPISATLRTDKFEETATGFPGANKPAVAPARPAPKWVSCTPGATSEWPKLKMREGVSFTPIVVEKKEAKPKRRFTPGDLERLETALAGADFTTYVACQHICVMSSSGQPTQVFAEYFIPIRKIETELLPQCSIATDAWLLMHLRRIIDRALLRTIPNLGQEVSMAVSLRADVDLILDGTFDAFHESRSDDHQRKIVVEFSAADVLAHSNQYLLARERLREMKYNICLGDMDPNSYMMVNRVSVPAEFEKFRFREDFLDSDNRIIDEFASAINRAGGHRVIMCACDSKEALEFGQRVGVHLYQGEFIEAGL